MSGNASLSHSPAEKHPVSSRADEVSLVGISISHFSTSGSIHSFDSTKLASDQDISF